MDENPTTKGGFTLIELMVAMAIIAALIGMSVFGINLVQRSQRNTERRSALNNINLGVRNYQIDMGVYPARDVATGIMFYADRVEINGDKVAELKGAAKAKGTGSTDSSSTVYCYEPDATLSTFSLAVDIEGSSTWFILNSDNTAATGCSGAAPRIMAVH